MSVALELCAGSTNRSPSCRSARFLFSWYRKMDSLRHLLELHYSQVFCVNPDSITVKELVHPPGLHFKYVCHTGGSTLRPHQRESVIFIGKSSTPLGLGVPCFRFCFQQLLEHSIDNQVGFRSRIE